MIFDEFLTRQQVGPKSHNSATLAAKEPFRSILGEGSAGEAGCRGGERGGVEEREIRLQLPRTQTWSL